MKGSLLFLGTSGSVGIPVIGCPCGVCHSNDPLNHRLRPSVLLNIKERQMLIDAGPDFRTQALRAGIKRLDGLLLTHAHYDHTAGLDDLRPLCYWSGVPLPVLLSPATADDVKKRFHYLFESDNQTALSRFSLHLMQGKTGSILFEDLLFHYVTYHQGGMEVNGFRIGDLAYLSDIRDFQPSIFDELKGIRYLVISALRYTRSPLHLSVDEAIDFANELKVENVWITHISHDLDHHKTNAYLPPHVRLAYDGLKINFD
ncbi:MAG: MBL fold metallo-hydrolase [Parachlamydiaceae bacterium]